MPLRSIKDYEGLLAQLEERQTSIISAANTPRVTPSECRGFEPRMVHLFKPIYHPFFNGKCTQAAPAIGRLALMRADLCARDGRPIAHPRRRTLEKTIFCVVCSMLVYYNDGSFCVCVCIDRRERTSEEKNRASSGVESLQTSLFLLRGRSLRRRRSLCSRLAHNFFFTARSDSHLFDHIRHFIAV